MPPYLRSTFHGWSATNYNRTFMICQELFPGFFWKSEKNLLNRQSLRMKAVVGSFLGDLDIMGMAFFQACAGNAHKLSFLVQLLNVGAAGVAHACPQASHHLEHSVRQGSLIRHAAFHAFGHELLLFALEVPVAAALAHSAQAAHAAIHLELAASAHTRRELLYSPQPCCPA